MKKIEEVELFIVIKEGTDKYYLLKVVRRGFDVYCFTPGSGIHYSRHKSGEAHFQSEEKAPKSGDELPIMMMDGEAGSRKGKGFQHKTLDNLGVASGIFNIIYSIDSLNEEYRKFSRRARECFVIDKDLLPKDTSLLHVGIWAVPARNKSSFEFNNRNINADLLYKTDTCEPQIWVFARPFS